MDTMSGRYPIPLLYPGVTSSDAQPALPIPLWDRHRDCLDTDPMSKAWIEYQQSRSGQTSSRGLSTTPLWSEEPFQRRISRGSENPERPEREESPALQRVNVPSGTKLVREEEGQQNSVDIMEKRKSVEEKINDLTINNQRLFERLNELDRCKETLGNREMLIHIADNDKQTVENTTPKVERQVFQEEKENLLQRNKDLETELVALKLAVKKAEKKLKKSNAEVSNLQNINLNLEKQLKSVNVSEHEEANLNGCEQEIYRNSENNNKSECQCPMDTSVAQEEKNRKEADTQDKNCCSYSNEQLKELLEQVDAATNKGNEKQEVLTGDTLCDTRKKEIQFQKFMSSITQCCVDDKNECRNPLEVKSTEEFEILRGEKNEIDVFGNQIISDSSSDHNLDLFQASSSDSRMSLPFKDPCSYCDKKVTDENLNTKKNVYQNGQEDTKTPFLREERKLVAQRLMSLLTCANDTNCQNEQNPCISVSDASPLSVLDQIKMRSKAMLYDNIKLYKAVFQLNEDFLDRGTTEGNISENSTNKGNPSRQNITQSSPSDRDSQREDDTNLINKELETLESFLIEKEEKTEEPEVLKKSGEGACELQEHMEHMEHQPTGKEISLSINDPEKNKNVTPSTVQVNGSCSHPSIDELIALKEAAELTEQSLKGTVHELETSLKETKAEILTLKGAYDKMNVEKNAVLVALDETKTGLAKASTHAVNLEKDLENIKEERNKLRETLKNVCDILKEEQEEKNDLQNKWKVSQEAITYTKIELQTVRAVLEKEKEARRIAKERERAVQEVLDEARQSRERLALELKMLIEYREKWHGQNSLQTSVLNQDDELKLRKLEEIVEKINYTMTEKVESHIEELKELFVLKEEVAFMREDNGSLKSKITQLSKQLNLNRAEKRKLSLEIERLLSILSSLRANESSTVLNKPESSEQLITDSERKQKERGSTKSLRRRFSRRSASSVNGDKTNSPSSKDSLLDQDKRISRMEEEIALLRDELCRHSLPSEDMSQDSPQSSSNDSEESETSELSFSQENKHLSVGKEVITTQIRGIQELEHEFDINSQLRELKQTLKAMIESTRNKINASNNQIRRIAEELESKDKILKSVQAELSSLEAKNKDFKKEMITLQDDLERERCRTVDSTERQKYLDQALKEALQSKAEMEKDSSLRHSGNSVLGDCTNNRNIATKNGLEDLRCMLQSIYEPCRKNEVEIKRLKLELIKRTEEMELLKTESKKYSSTGLNKELASLKMKLNQMQNEQKSLKEENELLKQQKDFIKEAVDIFSLKHNDCQNEVIKVLEMDSKGIQYHDGYENENLNYINRQKMSTGKSCKENEADGKCECKHNTQKENEYKEQPQHRTKLLKLKSDLNVAQQEKTHLESRLLFLNCASKSYEAEIYSLKEELEREITSKCAYKYREARLQETLSKYKEEIERLTNEIQRLYENGKVSEKKSQLGSSTENENAGCTVPNRTVDEGNLQITLHEMESQLQNMPNQHIEKLTKEKERREKTERELSLQRELSKKREKQLTETIEKLREELTRSDEKLKLMMPKMMEDQKQNKEVSQNLQKALEDKMKAEEEVFKIENQRRGVLKELEETKRTLHSIINAATTSKGDQNVWNQLKLFEEERKLLNQQLTINEKNRKKLEEQSKEEIKKLKEKIKVLEQCLTVTEEEVKRLQDENKKVEEEARKLSEQVSEEVENVRNESREIEADLQGRIEKLQTELKISEERLAEETEHFKIVCEECKKITRENQKCKNILEEFDLLKKEHETCRKTLIENERLRVTCNNLSDKMAVLSKELTQVEEENTKHQKTNLALRQASTVLYIEVITLRAQLEIMRAEKVKAIKTENLSQYSYHSVSSSDRWPESDASNCDLSIKETAVSENE